MVADLTGADDVRLVAIQRSSLGPIQDGHHFLKLDDHSRRNVPNQAKDMLTVGMDVLLLCRQDLPEQPRVHLTQTPVRAVPALRAGASVGRRSMPNRAPTAAIPLHPGAARYYREREILR